MQGTSDLSSLTLDGLFARARAGDQAAWEKLFHECYPKVRRVVRRRLNSPMRSLYDSTDFASDVWGSLLAKSDRFEFATIDALIAFLSKAAEQKVIDAHRHHHTLKNDIRRETRIDSAGPDETSAAGLVPSQDPTPSQEAVAKEGLEKIRSRLGELERSVLDLATLGHSSSEIAEKINRPQRKVQRILKFVHDSWYSPSGGRR